MNPRLLLEAPQGRLQDANCLATIRVAGLQCSLLSTSVLAKPDSLRYRTSQLIHTFPESTNTVVASQTLINLATESIAQIQPQAADGLLEVALLRLVGAELIFGTIDADGIGQPLQPGAQPGKTATPGQAKIQAGAAAGVGRFVGEGRVDGRERGGAGRRSSRC